MNILLIIIIGVLVTDIVYVFTTEFKIYKFEHTIKKLNDFIYTQQQELSKVMFTRIKTPKFDGDTWEYGDEIETIYVGKVGDKVKYIGWIDDEQKNKSNRNK